MKRTALFKTGMMTTVIVLALTFIMALMAVSFADKAYADVAAKGYKYKVTVYAGMQGEFKGGKKIWSKEVGAGETVTISEETTGFKLTNKEYYFRGFREAGHDNDEQLKSVTFTADEDTSFEVAYGIAGGMVKYVIQYVDEDGEELRDSDTYYGMVGDKPVVSYKYVNNYMPQAYHVTKTLSENEDENVFTFTYRSTTGQDGNNNNNNNTQITNPGRDGVNNGPNAVQPGTPAVNDDDGIANIDDQDGPLAPGNGDGDGNGNSNINDPEPPKSNSGAGKVNPMVIALIGGTAGLVAVFAAAAALMMKNRRNSEEA